MTLAYAIHQIIVSATETVEPGAVFSTDNFGELEHLGAVRTPTKQEAALHQMAAQSERAALEDLATSTLDATVSTDRAELEGRANAIGVEFKANIGDAKLLERIIEAEAKNAGADKDVKAPLV